jgi:hypothetical protein
MYSIIPSFDMSEFIKAEKNYEPEDEPEPEETDSQTPVEPKPERLE